MRNSYIANSLLLILLITSCGNFLQSERSETIIIDCTEANYDVIYEKVSTLINSINREEINNAILEKHPEINQEAFEGISLASSKTHKKTKIGAQSATETYHVEVQINNNAKGKNPDEVDIVMNGYKKYIKNDLLKNDINLGENNTTAVTVL